MEGDDEPKSDFAAGLRGVDGLGLGLTSTLTAAVPSAKTSQEANSRATHAVSSRAPMTTSSLSMFQRLQDYRKTLKNPGNYQEASKESRCTCVFEGSVMAVGDWRVWAHRSRDGAVSFEFTWCIMGCVRPAWSSQCHCALEFNRRLTRWSLYPLARRWVFALCSC